MRSKWSMGIAVTVLIFFFVTPVHAAKTFLSIATGSTAGTYYPIGGAVAKAVSKGSDIQATAETSNASVANINILAKYEIELAFVQNDIAFWAYNGKMMFNSPVKNIRAVAALYPEHVQLLVTQESGIKTLEDLKGKRVGVGAPGSGVEGDVRAIFQVAGLKYEDMTVDFLDYGGTASRFKDNQIDAGFVVSGFPTATIMDVSTTKNVALVHFDNAFVEKLSKEHPYFVMSNIPAKTYQGIDTDTPTPAVMAIIVTHDQLSDEVVYNFMSEMYKNIEDIHASHAKGKLINLESALEGLTVPLHPGAEKFYKEKGLLK